MGEALSAALPQIGVATWRIGAIHDRIVYVAVFVAQSPIGVAILAQRAISKWLPDERR